VDDRHFLVSGFAGDRLHAPFWTESDGKRVALFPIDERLRYLIPFQPPADIAAYLRQLRERGAPLAVFVDDGEKFGGWPGTKEWVYDRGWLAQFLDAMGALVGSGEIRRTTPAAARRAIGRAQCNDAYWHGVFGGLYLPHLRHAIWHQLALAEGELRRGAPLAVERVDLDGDGFEEIWIHAAGFSAVVSPRRGGVIEEYTRFGNGVNYAAVVTRRFEAYHALAREEAAQAAAPVPDGADGGESGAPSIHDIEKRVRLDRLPPVDRDGRALFVDRVLPADLTLDVYASGEYEPVVSWAAEPVAAEVRATG